MRPIFHCRLLCLLEYPRILYIESSSEGAFLAHAGRGVQRAATLEVYHNRPSVPIDIIREHLLMENTSFHV
jgi:hypothetical protein